MTRPARTRIVVGVFLTGAIALIGLTGCGRLGVNNSPAEADVTAAPWDAQALQAIGYTTEDVSLGTADATPAPGAGTDQQERRHKRLRFVFRNALHGEAVVQTDEGTKTVVAQRGTVTAASATSITVKSTDGFTLTWNVTSSTTVIVNRVKAEIGAVTVSTEVGVAGAKDGDTTNARLVVVPVKHN